MRKQLSEKPGGLLRESQLIGSGSKLLRTGTASSHVIIDYLGLAVAARLTKHADERRSIENIKDQLRRLTKRACMP